MKRLAVVISGLLFALPAAAQDLGGYEREAESVLQKLRGAMMAEMQKAMQSGAKEAIAVCRHLAPQIEAEIERETGWEVRRTGLKVRNPANAAGPLERGILLSFEARAGRQNPALMRTVRLVERDGAQAVQFVQAIPMFDLCEVCHGRDIVPDVMAEIRALYPDDQAVGYAPGDIRGAFSLLKPYDPASQPAKTDPRNDWTAMSALDLPEEVDLPKEGRTGNPASGRAAYGANCRSCHCPADLADHFFGADVPAGHPGMCEKLETHGITDAELDCDIAAFLKLVAELPKTDE